MHNNSPKNTREAVELGLYLAITAETEEASKEALQIAKWLSCQTTYGEGEIAKINVRRYIERERAGGAEYPQSPPRMAVPIKRAMKPKRLTRELILDAIGCPNLVMMRVKNETPMPFTPAYLKANWRFVYLKQPGTNLMLHYLTTGRMKDQVVAFLDVDFPRLKDLTLEQWVHHGLTLIEQVKLRRELSDVIDAVSPSKTPFMTKGRDVNLNDWET
mgnify:CR=1 FL=1